MKLRRYVAALLTGGLITLGLAAPASAAMPDACNAHGIEAQQITQGPAPASGVNAWRETGGIVVPSDGCGGIWMSSDLLPDGTPACGWFFADRVSPLPHADWTPTSVCTSAVKIVNVCASCSMAEGFTFAWYQAAGPPYSGAHAGRYYLWY